MARNPELLALRQLSNPAKALNRISQSGDKVTGAIVPLDGAAPERDSMFDEPTAIVQLSLLPSLQCGVGIARGIREGSRKTHRVGCRFGSRCSRMRSQHESRVAE